MKQTKQFLRPLLMAIVMLVGMLVPQGAWAQELEVGEEETISISSDASYDMIYVFPGGMLIINEGVTLTVTSGLNIHGDDNMNLYGTVINYGTIKGEGSINMDRGVLANHGHIDLMGVDGYGTFYNTGTPGDDYFNLTSTECNHAYYDELGPVDATCTHGAGTQFKCYTCHYIWFNETGEPLPHDNYDHNGLTVCSTCGQLTFDATPVGEGTAESPYQIANAGHLFWFADKVNNDFDNFKDANAVLTADIVVNDGTFAANGAFTATGASGTSTPIEWLIIARFVTYSHGYRGTFDGQGHTISGLYANYEYSGFVGMSSGECKIKNVGVINSYFASIGDVGGICGDAGNNTEISNCYSSNVICKGNYVGGILGCATNTGVSIVNCYSTASLIGVEDWAHFGGIAAQSGSTTNCYTTYGNATDSSESEINCEANVTLERFASGEIAYKLNGSVDGEGNWTAGTTDGTQKWYQKLGENGDSYPVLAAAEGNTVYEQKTIDCGGTVVACNYNNTEEEDVTQPHDYQVQLDENKKPVFVWSEDCTTATLQLVCSHNAEHTSSVDAHIESWVTDPATCTTTGVHAYSATVEYDGQTYADYKNVEIAIDPNAHDIGVDIELYAVDYEDIITYLDRQELMPETSLTIRCKKCDKVIRLDDTEVISDYSITYEITRDPNCWMNGVYNFNLEITIPSGDIYSISKDSNINATGLHTFTNNTLTASPVEDGLYAYVCDREECGEHNDAHVIKDFNGEGHHLELTKDGEGNYSTSEDITIADGAPFSSPVDFTANRVTYTRTFGGTNWTTWYVPFELELTDEICQKLAFSRINNVHQYDDNGDGNADRTIIESFRQKAGVTLKANYPYLVKALDESAQNFSLTLSDVTLAPAKENSIDCQSVDYLYTFTGTYTGMGDSGLSSYSLFDDEDSNNWLHFHSLEPQRHYMTITPRNGGNGAGPAHVKLRVVGDEDASGIVTIYSAEQQCNGTYDLMGRKLDSNSKQPGLRIVNGKKVLFK